MSEKTFPVTVDASAVPISNGYMLNKTTAVPAEITLRGPTSELDQVSSIVAPVQIDGELADTTTVPATLQLRDEVGNVFTPQYISMESDSANVTLTVYQVRELPLKVDFIGTPNGFDVESLTKTYKKFAVVGGGIGTAPMYQVARELAAAGCKPDVFFGFRDKPYCMEEYRSIANLVKVSTDTGAVGFHGFVTQLYDPADYDAVLVCGPTVMMKNAARLCAEKHTPCFVSLEKKMACGIGACLGCTCETKSGEGKSVCKNGPVFDATEVF